MASRTLLWLTDAEALREEDLQRYRGWLSASELARHQRFVRALRQRQFVAGRVLLRQALGRLLDMAPQDVGLEEQAGQAPRLAVRLPRGVAAGYSIAHSGRWVACAASLDAALGLDIELRDPARDLAALAQQAFDAGELAQWSRLDAMPPQERLHGFYRMWAEKEARFKLGQGRQGACLLLPHEELALVLCSDPPLAQAPRIELVTLP